MKLNSELIPLAPSASLPVSTFEGSSIPACLVGRSGTLHYINPAGVHFAWRDRFTREEVVGRSLPEIGPAEYFDERVRFVRKQIDEKKHGLIRSIRDGKQILIHIKPLPSHEGFPEPVALVIAEQRSGRISSDDLAGIEMLNPATHDLGVLATLSPRELEVLAYVGMGLGVDETALRLHRSRETVISHRKALMRKLNCTNAVQLAALAVRAGLHPHDGSRVQHVSSHEDVLKT